MDLVSIFMMAGGVALAGWVVYSVRAMRGEVRSMREHVAGLAGGFRASAAAMITEGAPGNRVGPSHICPAPVLARSALLPVAPSSPAATSRKEASLLPAMPSERPTRLGGLAASGAEPVDAEAHAGVGASFQGPWIDLEAHRAARARQAARARAETTVPATTPAPVAFVRDPAEEERRRIMARWAVLCAEADARGLAAYHCDSAACWSSAPDVEVCGCSCEGCTRAGELLLQAQREITGHE